jgi:phosphoglycolate phosphatase
MAADELSALEGATVVFDLDGTLVDTAPDLVGTLDELLAHEGLPPLGLEAGRLLIGGGPRAMIARGFEQAGASLSGQRLAKLTERFLARYAARLVEASRPYPGAGAALARLKAAGARLAVCTNKPTDLAIGLMRGLGLERLFSAVVGPDAAPARKPDPRHLLAAIAAAGGDPRRALMVGDSAGDAQAARAARVPLILVSFGYADPPAAQLAPDVLVDHFRDLPRACVRLLAACGGPGAKL